MKNKIVNTLLIIVIIIGLLGVGWIVNFNKIIEGDLLAYSGAIIGGGLTLLGVIMTINYQEKTRNEDNDKRDRERKEELSIQYKPIITVKDLKAFQINNQVAFEIHFENVGRGEALNTEFHTIEVVTKTDHILKKFETKTEILATNESMVFCYVLINIDKYNKFIPVEDRIYNFKGILTYYNPIDNKLNYTFEIAYYLHKAIHKDDFSKIDFSKINPEIREEWELVIENWKVID